MNLPRTEAILRLAVPVALVGLGVEVIAGILWPARLFPSYLMVFLFWMGITLGCFPVLMIHHLVGGKWGYSLRRFLEAGLGTLPLMAVLCIPIFFGFRQLYPWARPEVIETHDALRARLSYLNGPGVIIRSILFFVVWFILAYLLVHWSRRQDKGDGVRPLILLRTLSGPGLVAFTLATTFAYVDWVMALEPDWFSSIFPVLVMMGQILSALSLGLVLFTVFQSRFPGLNTPDQFNNLGSLLFAFVLMWAYMAVTQLIIIYAGNLPHEIVWYLHRTRHGWARVAIIVAVLQFVVPFALLLFRGFKRNPKLLAGLGLLIFLLQAISTFWYVAPSFRPSVKIDWLDPIGFVAVGSAWLAIFGLQLNRGPLLPKNDPRLVNYS